MEQNEVPKSAKTLISVLVLSVLCRCALTGETPVSRDCFRPRDQSDYYLNALSPLTSLTTKDFSTSEKNSRFKPRFELICEDPHCNLYVISLTGENSTLTWFYGLRVEITHSETVSVTKFVKSKELSKVYDELELKMTNGSNSTNSSEFRDDLTRKNSNKTQFISIESFLHSKASDQDTNDANTQQKSKNANFLLSRRKDDWFGRSAHKDAQPIVSKPKTTFVLGHRKRQIAESEDQVEEQMEESPVLIDKQKPAVADKEEDSFNRFDQLVASVGEERANNWRSVSKAQEGGISILSALNHSKQASVTDAKSRPETSAN